jgi:hypothetical protein
MHSNRSTSKSTVLAYHRGQSVTNGCRLLCQWCLSTQKQYQAAFTADEYFRICLIVKYWMSSILWFFVLNEIKVSDLKID